MLVGCWKYEGDRRRGKGQVRKWTAALAEWEASCIHCTVLSLQLALFHCRQQTQRDHSQMGSIVLQGSYDWYWLNALIDGLQYNNSPPICISCHVVLLVFQLSRLTQELKLLIQAARPTHLLNLLLANRLTIFGMINQSGATGAFDPSRRLLLKNHAIKHMLFGPKVLDACTPIPHATEAFRGTWPTPVLQATTYVRTWRQAVCLFLNGRTPCCRSKERVLRKGCDSYSSKEKYN